MSYATIADLTLAAGGEVKLVALFDEDLDGVADADLLARAQAAADGLLDGHLRLKLGLAELEYLRANPTTTISSLAADEAVYWRKKALGMATPEDIDARKERERQLALIRAGQFRPADAPKAQRAVFIENDTEFSRKRWP